MLDAKKIKLGIAPIAWTNDDMPELGGEIPFEQCIREMKEAGFVGTEVGSKYPKDPEKLKAALKPYGLSIASQWFSSFFTPQDDASKTIEDFKKHMAFLKALGAKVIVISEQGSSIQGQMNTPVLGKKPVLDETGWKRLAHGLNAIGKLAKDNGMKIVYHHHMGTVVQTRAEVDQLMKRTDPALVWLLADTGHMYFSDGGDAPEKMVQDYIARIAHIHLKDIREDVKKKVASKKLSFLQAVKEGVFTVPGDGAVHFEPVFKAIEKSKYEGWFIVEAEQDPAKASPLQYAKMAREYIKKMTGL